MNTVGDLKLINNLMRSQERRKFYSASTNKTINAFKCPEHNEYFSKICLKCNIDICFKCEKKYHNNHHIIQYDDINPDSSEIECLKNKINDYINKYNILKREIFNWYNELKQKIYDFETSIKNNELNNSLDFLTNYSKNKRCLNTILKFRKIYYNLMEENNCKNTNVISLFKKYGIIDKIDLPSYYDYYGIKKVLHKLNYNKENLIKKSEYLINYLALIPYLGNNNSISSIKYNNTTESLNKSKSSTNYNLLKNPFYLNSNDIKNSNSIADKSTDIKNYDSNYNNNKYKDKSIKDSKVEEFKNILNKTKIPEFSIKTKNENENTLRSNKSFCLSDKKNCSINNFTKYLNKIGLLNINDNDLHKENSSQDLLNSSSCSIKSTKYVPNRSTSYYNENNKKYIYKNNNNNLSSILSYNYKYDNNYIKKEIKEKENKEKEIKEKESKVKESIQKVSFVNNALINSKNAQIKTYVHKKFSNNSKNINKMSVNNINNNYFFKFQKKVITTKPSNNLQRTPKKEKEKEIENTQEISKKNENIINNININNNNYNNEKFFINKINNNNSQEILIKNTNDDILQSKDKIKNDKKYLSPKKPDISKKGKISDDTNKKQNDYDNDNEESNIGSTEKKDLLNIIYSPSTNKNQSTNKKNINGQINKNINTNIDNNSVNIIKTNKNSPFFVDKEKELCIGLELGNSECKVGIVNQNTKEIQLVCFEEEKYTIPTIVSFGENKKEINIGYKADEDIFNHPSQSIFNIVKFFGQKFNEIKGRNELWPFKVCCDNDDNNKPYIKINYGSQKDIILYFENILSIFLEKLFEFVFNRVVVENSPTSDNKNNNKENGEEIYSINNSDIITLKIVLVLTVPNYFSYYQRKLLENIFKNEIFPDINNNELKKIYGKYRINLLGLRIENASSIASLCLNNYDNDSNNSDNKNNNILILNIDGGSANISITSSFLNENNKQLYQTKIINGLSKGGTDLTDDFMYEVLEKLEKKIQKEILNSPLSLVKLRKLCEKIRIYLLENEKYSFNISEIIDNHNYLIEIYRINFDNSSFDFFNDIKSLIYNSLTEAKINEQDINNIIFIGDLCREKKIIEIFRQEKYLYEDVVCSRYMDNEKDYYIVGGAAYHAMNVNNINNDTYSFYDISPYNIGIENYNGSLDYLIIKGDTIPIKNTKTIRIKNGNEMKIYEKNEKEENKRLIGKIIIKNKDNNNMSINTEYREVKIEYEINDKLEILIKELNGEKYEDAYILYENF